MRYLLDTNVLSDLMRHPGGAVAQRIAEVGERAVCTSIVVAAELRYGAEKKGSRSLSERVEAVLGVMEVVPLEEPADAAYGALRADLERRGAIIGGNDMLIAAQALSLGYTLVTDNVAEFSRVTGLRYENWVR